MVRVVGVLLLAGVVDEVGVAVRPRLDGLVAITADESYRFSHW